jgi:thiol:disulfide interchange protein DsbC
VIAVGGALLLAYGMFASVQAQSLTPNLTNPTPADISGSSPGAVEPQDSDAHTLLQRLKSLYPGTRFGSVHTTPWPGVFEISMGATIAYADASGRHFLFGHLYDMHSQTDLTAQRKDALSRVDVAMLPRADALTEVRGTGARKLFIFSDPDCPFCRRLESDLGTLNDVTIHTFLLPLTSLHPQARDKAVAVWCAPDPLAAWKALMLLGTPPPAPSSDCAHPVDRNIALGERMGIHGTPTLIAGDGRLMQGAQDASTVSAWLDRRADRQAAGPATDPATDQAHGR